MGAILSSRFGALNRVPASSQGHVFHAPGGRGADTLDRTGRAGGRDEQPAPGGEARARRSPKEVKRGP